MSDINQTERLEDASIICAEPIDALAHELKRRRSERFEERPGEEPLVSIAWVLDELVTARNLGSKRGRWLDLQTVADIGVGSPETARRRWHDAPEKYRRANSLNGKYELHIEYVAELLDQSVEEVEERRDGLKEAA